MSRMLMLCNLPQVTTMTMERLLNLPQQYRPRRSLRAFHLLLMVNSRKSRRNVTTHLPHNPRAVHLIAKSNTRNTKSLVSIAKSQAKSAIVPIHVRELVDQTGNLSSRSHRLEARQSLIRSVLAREAEIDTDVGINFHMNLGTKTA